MDKETVDISHFLIFTNNAHLNTSTYAPRRICTGTLFFSETGITPTGKHPFGYFIILRPLKIVARFTFILSWLKSTTITCTLGPHTIQQTQDTAPT